ncbi:MAG: DUF1592 domain-containing protein [Myxococcota bacterium]
MAKLKYVLLALLLGGCTGLLGGCTGEFSTGEGGSTGPGPGGGRVVQPPPPGGCVGAECETAIEVPQLAPRFARLTHAQWEATVRDLFRLTETTGESANFDADSADGTFTTDVRRLVVTEGLWPDYQRSAEAIAATVAADEASVARWSSGVPAGAADREAFIQDFVLHAYRRPIRDEELTRLVALYGEGATHFPSLSAELAGVRLVIEGVLQSPSFLYRTESSDEVVDGLVPLDGYEIASRLSYMIWGTMPDDMLLSAAAAGDLASDAGIEEQARRLLADPQAAALYERFHEEHFHMDDWADYSRETEVFPAWEDGLARSYLDETNAFLAHLVDSDLGVTDLLMSRTAFVDGKLGELYGVGSGQVELGDDRAGFLTRLAFLGRYAARRVPDPIHRGLFINEHILCRDIPDPPMFDAEDLMFEGTTNRERINSVTGPSTCGAGCHGTIINPPGFALEGYDSIGQFRTMDNGQVVDDTATYVFEDNETRVTVSGAVELSQALADSAYAHECYAERLIEYSLGRPYFDGDSPLVYRLGRRSLEGEVSLKEMMVELALSRTFRTRAADELAMMEAP